jgi:transposase
LSHLAYAVGNPKQFPRISTSTNDAGKRGHAKIWRGCGASQLALLRKLLMKGEYELRRATARTRRSSRCRAGIRHLQREHPLTLSRQLDHQKISTLLWRYFLLMSYLLEAAFPILCRVRSGLRHMSDPRKTSPASYRLLAKNSPLSRLASYLQEVALPILSRARSGFRPRNYRKTRCLD